MGAALYLYWITVEPALGAEVLERALSEDVAGVALPVRAKATWVLAELCEHIGRYKQAEPLAAEAFTMAEEAGELAVAAQARKVSAGCALARGEPDGTGTAIRLMDEAWELAERSGDPLAIAFVIHDTGNVLFDVGDNEGARVKFATRSHASAGREVVWASLRPR